MDANGWIRVEERLPEDNGDGSSNPVLTVDMDIEDPVHGISYYDFEWHEWYDPATADMVYLTHWQPLPPLPAVEAA